MNDTIMVNGSDTLLHPLTQAVIKQLLPVHCKPMIYYAPSTLVLEGIRKILIVARLQDQAPFGRRLCDGSAWEITNCCAELSSPNSVAQAFLIGADSLAITLAALLLGDNFLTDMAWCRNWRAAMAVAKR